MKHKKIVLFTGMILAALLCGHLLGWSAYIGGERGIALLRQTAKEHLPTAVLLYCVFTAVGCVVLALPGITFAILAGLLFGPVLGTLCCSAATTLGAMGAFLAGRYFLKDSIRPIVLKNRYLKKWLFDESEKNAVFVLMLTRLVPLFPYNIQNFAYGVTDISFGTYSICSFLFMLPGTAMYTVGMAGLADRDNRILYMGAAAGLFAAVMGLSRFMKKRYVTEREEQNGEPGR